MAVLFVISDLSSLYSNICLYKARYLFLMSSASTFLRPPFSSIDLFLHLFAHLSINLQSIERSRNTKFES